jgi:hypothetical protein
MCSVPSERTGSIRSIPRFAGDGAAARLRRSGIPSAVHAIHGATIQFQLNPRNCPRGYSSSCQRSLSVVTRIRIRNPVDDAEVATATAERFDRSINAGKYYDLGFCSRPVDAITRPAAVMSLAAESNGSSDASAG